MNTVWKRSLSPGHPKAVEAVYPLGPLTEAPVQNTSELDPDGQGLNLVSEPFLYHTGDNTDSVDGLG